MMRWKIIFFAIISVVAVQEYDPQYDQEECGLMDPAHAMDTKVLGGNEIKAAVLPFVVLIRIEKSDFPCTGTLISKRHVITAAHCFEENCRRKLFVQLTLKQKSRMRRRNITDDGNVKGVHICYGTNDVSSNCTDPGSRRYAVRKIRFFEEYWERNCDVRRDAVILELAQEVEHGVPVCLPYGRNDVPMWFPELNPPPSLYVAGYSDNNYAWDGPKNTKLQFGKTGANIPGCIGDKPSRANQLMLCMKWHSKEAALCSGDEGGPLLLMINGRWVLVGISLLLEGGICHPSGVEDTNRTAVQYFLKTYQFVAKMRCIIGKGKSCDDYAPDWYMPMQQWIYY